MIRKLARADINRFELTLLRGDPLLAFLRDTLDKVLGREEVQVPFKRRGPARQKPQNVPTGDVAEAGDSEQSQAAFWLREQFERGALPKDPLLVQSLLEQAKRDPQLVARLVSENKDFGGSPFSKYVEGASGGK